MNLLSRYVRAFLGRGLRNARGWWYRGLPAFSRRMFSKKIAGFERRWQMEEHGFTKEGFYRVFQRHLLAQTPPGRFLELVAGDGLVGSLGVWLEATGAGWKVEAWEHRSFPKKALLANRPNTQVHGGRLTAWPSGEGILSPVGITTRGVREAVGLCRAIRRKMIRPQLMGIWNPTRRPVWYRRLQPEGYRLELVWQNIEFYGDGRRKTGDR